MLPDHDLIMLLLSHQKKLFADSVRGGKIRTYKLLLYTHVPHTSRRGVPIPFIAFHERLVALGHKPCAFTVPPLSLAVLPG